MVVVVIIYNSYYYYYTFFLDDLNRLHYLEFMKHIHDPFNFFFMRSPYGMDEQHSDYFFCAIQCVASRLEKALDLPITGKILALYFDQDNPMSAREICLKLQIKKHDIQNNLNKARDLLHTHGVLREFRNSMEKCFTNETFGHMDTDHAKWLTVTDILGP